MPSSSQVADDLLAALPARGVLAARGVPAAGRSGSWTAESTFSFSARRSCGVERDRLLHRGQREQLQQVVLDDVAGRADAVVVAGPAADADVLGHGDLHVVDVVARSRSARTAGWRTAAPAGSGRSPCPGSGRSGRPSRAGRPTRHDLVELARRLQVVPERLLDDDPPPRVAVLRRDSPERSSCLARPGRTSAGSTGRRRGCRPCRGSSSSSLDASRRSWSNASSSSKSPGHEADALGQLLPDLLAERRPGVLP